MIRKRQVLVCMLFLVILSLSTYALAKIPFFWWRKEKDEAKVKDEVYRQRRMKMVEYQIIQRGVKDKRVLEAMRKVPRHEFVLDAFQEYAYEDHPLPIGEDQTISQPYIVALMTELVELKGEKGEKVLEIGTGSGYQAAILAEIAGEVCTIEILEPLALRAQETLKNLGYKNIEVKIGDGFFGWPEEAPFDGIIVTCATEEVPKPLVEQLKRSGRMIIPIGPSFSVQNLVLVRKDQKGNITQESIIPVRFVPMLGEH